MAAVHPGGSEMTRRLFALGGLVTGTDRSASGWPSAGETSAKCPRAIDLGAGYGEAVSLLREAGFDAVGVDLEPGTQDGSVIKADMLETPFDDGIFDLVFSECALFISGDQIGAVREASRLLKPGGQLLAGDVFFADRAAVEEGLRENGLFVEALEDVTTKWREYYIEAVWNGRIDIDGLNAFFKEKKPAAFRRDARKLSTGQLTGKTCRYYLISARKGASEV